MALDICIGIQNQLSDWFYLFIWWIDSIVANLYFWKYFFRFGKVRWFGGPHIYFFRFFFDGKIFFVHLSFFSENGVRNKLQTKESWRFFLGGVIMTPLRLTRVNPSLTNWTPLGFLSAFFYGFLNHHHFYWLFLKYCFIIFSEKKLCRTHPCSHGGSFSNRPLTKIWNVKTFIQ